MAIYCSSHFTLHRDLPLHKDTANAYGRAAAGEPTLLEWERFGEWYSIAQYRMEICLYINTLGRLYIYTLCPPMLNIPMSLFMM